MKINEIAKHKNNKNHNGWEKWQERVLLAVDKKGVAADKLAVLFNRSVGSVRRQATKQGVSLRIAK